MMEIAEQLIYIGWTVTKLGLVTIVFFFVFGIFVIFIKAFLEAIRSRKGTKFKAESTKSKPLEVYSSKKGGRNDPPKGPRPPKPQPMGVVRLPQNKGGEDDGQN